MPLMRSRAFDAGYDGRVVPCLTHITEGALPPGMTLDMNTGVLHGRPTAVGKYAAKVKVECGTESDSRWLSFEVTTPAPFDPWIVVALVVALALIAGLVSVWLIERRKEA